MMKFAIVAALAACAAASCVDERREALGFQNQGAIGVFVPQCEADGSWSSLQFHGSTGMSHCRLPEGTKVNDGSRTLRHCECPVKRHLTLNSGLIGARVPQCEENGLFKKIQCHELYCHCAHPVTGERLSNSVHISQLESLKC